MSAPNPISRRRFFVAFNPGAGRSHRTFLDSVLAQLRVSGGIVDMARAVTAQSARVEAKAAAGSGAYDAIVAAGGDGTIRQIAAAVAGSGVPIGIIPIGTGNVLAHEIAMPRRAGAIAHVLATGPVIAITHAVANDEPFLLMAGAGFDGRVVQGLDVGWKQWIGKAAYVGPALAAFSGPLDCLDIVLDGKKHQATWAVIANARHFGGRFVIAPRTHIATSGLQAVLFHARSRSVLLKQLTALGLGRLERLAERPPCDVQMIACVEARITSAVPVPVQIDGDDFATTPLVVRPGTGSIDLIVPG